MRYTNFKVRPLISHKGIQLLEGEKGTNHNVQMMCTLVYSV